MKTIVLVVVWLLSLVLAAAFASNAALKNQLAAFNEPLQEAQAILWVNHLLDYRNIEADLAAGCTDVAHEKIRIAIDGELRLLSSFHKEYTNSKLNEYISARDSNLLGQLETYKSPYGDSWTVPQCTNSKRSPDAAQRNPGYKRVE